MSERTPGWCATHDDFAWLYGDGSIGCFGATIVEESSSGCVLDLMDAPDSLDAAWAEAEAALPEGGYLNASPWNVGTGAEPVDGWLISARWPKVARSGRKWGEHYAYGEGPTPARALRALAAALRQEVGG